MIFPREGKRLQIRPISMSTNIENLIISAIQLESNICFILLKTFLKMKDRICLIVDGK